MHKHVTFENDNSDSEEEEGKDELKKWQKQYN